MPMAELELKTPGELLDEIIRLRKALQKIADLPLQQRNDRKADVRIRTRRIALAALGSKDADITKVGRKQAA